MLEKELQAYTDGGSNDNPGEAGWAFFIEDEVRCSGYGGIASNNEMELRAMIECLKYIGKNRKAVIRCDSTYVIKGITDWIDGWMSRGWRTSSGNPVANRELWEELYSVYNPDAHKFLYVKGHSGVFGNELCDQLVQEAKVGKYERQEINLRSKEVNSTPEEVNEAFERMVSKFEKLTEYDKRLCAGKFCSNLSEFHYKVRQYE